MEGAVEAFNKLIDEQGVSVIIGPTTSAQSEVVFPVAQQNQVVVLVLPQCLRPGSDWRFYLPGESHGR